MQHKMKNWLLGDLGIDTPYEEHLVYYRPYLKAYKAKLDTYMSYDQIPKELERINQNKLSDVLDRYLLIIEDFRSIREKILAKVAVKDSETFILYRRAIKEDDIERVHAMMVYDKSPQVIDWKPVYTLVAHILKSLNVQLDFLTNKYGTQLASDKEITKIKEAENKRIQGMINLTLEIDSIKQEFNQPAQSTDDVDYHDHEHGTISSYRSRYFNQEYQEVDINHLRSVLGDHVYFHETIADISFINDARCDALDQIVDLLNVYVDYRVSLVTKDIEVIAKQLFDNEIAKETMAISLESFNERTGNLYLALRELANYTYSRQHFINDRQLFLQKKRIGTDTVMLSYLNDVVYEDSSESLTNYYDILISGVERNRKQYKDGNGELYNFYEEEMQLYQSYLMSMLDAEESRLLFLAAQYVSELESFHFIDFKEWLTIRKKEAEEEEV